jgi:hypothetical protein
MVNDSGQLYTIEGIAAGVLMIVTAYLVVSTTTILTPQDVHIIDMQFQQLGNDALAMMDTSDTYGDRSNLSFIIEDFNGTRFRSDFLRYLNATTGAGPSAGGYQFNATVCYRTTTGVYHDQLIATQPYYRENAVKVSRWVFLPDGITNHTSPIDMLEDGNPHSVLLEVLLWRE